MENEIGDVEAEGMFWWGSVSKRGIVVTCSNLNRTNKSPSQYYYIMVLLYL